jgi:predicted dehydrogenase
MADNNYRAGIIGLGMIGGADSASAEAIGQSVDRLDGTHYGALSDHDRVQVVAGSSRDAGRRDRFAQRSGANVYADFREMLEREKPDIVSIASYSPAHAEHAVASAEAGAKAIYCEKPVTTTAADGDRVVAACQKHGTLLIVNHQRRFDPNLQKLREMITAGQLGDLTSCLLQWGSGRLGNVGTHTIDAIRMLTSRQVEAVSGHLDLSRRPDCRGSDFQDPGGWGMLRMEGGLIVLVDAADYGTVPFLLVLNGTKGLARIGGDGVRLEMADGKTEHWPVVRDKTTFMHGAVAEIVNCLDGDKTPAIPTDDAVRTLEAIVAFHVSHDRHAAWVDLPLRGADRQREVRSG